MRRAGSLPAAGLTTAAARHAFTQPPPCRCCAAHPPVVFVSSCLFSISERQARAVQKSNRLRRDVERFQAKIVAVREAAAAAKAAAAAPPAQSSPRPRSHTAQQPRSAAVTGEEELKAQRTQQAEQQEGDGLNEREEANDAKDAHSSAAAAAGEEVDEGSAERHAERKQMRRVLEERIVAHQQRQRHPAVLEALTWSDAALLSDASPQLQPAPPAAAPAARTSAGSRPVFSSSSSTSSSPSSSSASRPSLAVAGHSVSR